MPYFFFSYACSNAESKGDAYVTKFFNDLQFEIQHKAQPPVAGDVGFRDFDHIETGDHLHQKLVTALRTCRVFVPLYSPLYFTRPACGREWHAFTTRLQDFATAAGKPNELPPLILPVWWAPVDLKQYGLPQSITSLKYTLDDLGAEKHLSEKYKKEGLLQLLQLDHPDYMIFVTRFAERMRDVVAAHVLKDAPQMSKFDELTNAFAAPAHAAAVGPDGPKHVEILIAAGRAAQFGHRPARQAFYGDRPESWRPYHPQVAKAIGPFAQTTAGSADFTSMLVEVGPGLDARIKQAKKKQNLIVLIIDPWSLDVGQLREHLQEYDVLDLRNCTAFVIWNDDDPETKAERAVLQKRLAKVFENKMAGARPFKGFRDDVDSLKKLENDLRDVLIQIHQSIVEREEVPRKAEGDQEVALAQVQGPGDTKPP